MKRFGRKYDRKFKWASFFSAAVHVQDAEEQIKWFELGKEFGFQTVKHWVGRKYVEINTDKLISGFCEEVDI